MCLARKEPGAMKKRLLRSYELLGRSKYLLHSNLSSLSRNLGFSFLAPWGPGVSPSGYHHVHKKGGRMDNPSEPQIVSNDQTPKVFVLPYINMPLRWHEYSAFAHEFDGYSAYPDNLGELANKAVRDWNENQVLSDDLILLRSCLFYEARRSRFVEGYPTEDDMAYLDALVEKIRKVRDAT